MGYQSPASRPCNIFTCQTNNDCSQNGVCTSGSCQCSKGFTGASCNIAFGSCAESPNGLPSTTPPPSSLSATTPLCCSTGVVDSQGTCCQSGGLYLLVINNQDGTEVKHMCSRVLPCNPTDSPVCFLGVRSRILKRQDAG